MGFGFAILIHLILLFILSCVIAFIASIVTYFISGKEKRGRKIFLAIISPFIGLYTFYFCAGVGSVIISAAKGIDTGVGDYWYVPLSDKCRLSFIDTPEEGFIECNDETVISDISHLQQAGNKIYVETYTRKYFLFHVVNKKLQAFSDENDFRNTLLKDKIIMKNAQQFYNNRKLEIAGLLMTIVLIVSLTASLFAIYLARRIVLI